MAREHAQRTTKNAAPSVEKPQLRSRPSARGAAVRATAVTGTPVEKPTNNVEATDDSDATDDSESMTMQHSVSRFIETVEVQTAMVALIAFDVSATVATLLLRGHHEVVLLQSLMARSEEASKKKGKVFDVVFTEAASAVPSAVASVVLRVLDSLAGFTIVLFIIELVVLGVMFRGRFVAHPGYLIDFVVVGSSVVVEIYCESNAIRLLGILRVWRVFRLVGTLLEREQADHEITMDALELEKTRVLQLQFEKQAAEQSLKREYDSRAGIERMLQGYKDEADTLREALTIAARTVAEATMQGFTPAAEGDDVTEAYDEKTQLGEAQVIEEDSAAYGGEHNAAGTGKFSHDAYGYGDDWEAGQQQPVEAQAELSGEGSDQGEDDFADAREDS